MIFMIEMWGLATLLLAAFYAMVEYPSVSCAVMIVGSLACVPFTLYRVWKEARK